MRLARIAQRFEAQTTRIDQSIETNLLGGRALGRHEKWALQEGYLSQKWQAWCGFCRAVAIASCKGAEDSSGTMTTSPYARRSDLELAWIAARASRQEAYANVRALAGHHQEPTWDDAGKISFIINALNPTNSGTLLSGILAGASAARHLQIVRNSTAHLSPTSIAEVRSIASSYVPSGLTAPSDAMLWEDRALRDFAYRAWSSRLIAAARIAVA